MVQSVIVPLRIIMEETFHGHLMYRMNFIIHHDTMAFITEN